VPAPARGRAGSNALCRLQNGDRPDTVSAASRRWGVTRAVRDVTLFRLPRRGR